MRLTSIIFPFIPAGFTVVEESLGGTAEGDHVEVHFEQVRAWLEEVQQVAQTGCMEDVQSKLAALLEKLPEDHL